MIVSGMVAAQPRQGGATWAVLQYVLGLGRLGHEVYLVEPVDATDEQLAASAEWCNGVMDQHGMGDRWCLVRPGHGETAGLSRSELRDIARRAAVLLNVSGMLTDPDVVDAVPVRVYLDLDPGFVQLWHEVEHIDMRFDAHTHFVTVSDAVGRTIPDCGRTWLPTLPPVVLQHWPLASAVTCDAFTTVANWRGYGSIHHDGRHYGQKAHSLRPLFGLPRQIGERFVIALSIHRDETGDLAALAENGWELVDPGTVAATPDQYQRFIQGSKAEIGIAKTGYVVSDSGWFSDRSACYLASGRPVVAQDTGFGRRLPCGDGLFAFSDGDDVRAAVKAINSDYEAHRRAARALAEEYLDSDRVLTALLDRVT